MIKHRVPARAALAGNPSDGYGGAVLSVPLPVWAATVTILGPDITPTSAEIELVRATKARFAADRTPTDGFAVEVATTIPRSVGLAGSSAIVIATIRALAEATEASLTDRDVAEMAHTIERVDMGIAGGWQDQIIQSNRTGLPLLMEFAEPITAAVVTPAPIPLFVAYSTGGAQPSGISHADLRSRAHELADVMGELAELARAAADALASHNTHELKQAIDTTFDLRSTIMTIEPAHRAMIDAAREAGAACNFAGSGGAISGVVPKDSETFVAALESAGLTVVTWTPGGDRD